MLQCYIAKPEAHIFPLENFKEFPAFPSSHRTLNRINRIALGKSRMLDRAKVSRNRFRIERSCVFTCARAPRKVLDQIDFKLINSSSRDPGERGKVFRSSWIQCLYLSRRYLSFIHSLSHLNNWDRLWLEVAWAHSLELRDGNGQNRNRRRRLLRYSGSIESFHQINEPEPKLP